MIVIIFIIKAAEKSGNEYFVNKAGNPYQKLMIAIEKNYFTPSFPHAMIKLRNLVKKLTKQNQRRRGINMEDKNVCLEKQPLSQEMLEKMNAYWRAANYLSAGQLYLLDNPLLKEPLTMDHIKKKIVGHWGTVPGQNFVYVHCNRAIKRYDLDMILLSGPGHGGNFLIANTYLEGTYSEVYPNISQDEEGMKKLFKQFSFPCGVPSHCAPETPGSINEGGELGYSIAHGFGAVFDNPDLIATVVVGDGEAETGPLATSWQSNKFLNPITDGAVLPILHLNGYKISNPTIFSRISREEIENFFKGCGWKPYFVEGDDP